MITRNNYEIWLIDYQDGVLTPAEKALVEEFLKKNNTYFLVDNVIIWVHPLMERRSNILIFIITFNDYWLG